MGYLHYKGYKGSVEYSEEDNCLCGKALGLKKTLISYEGNTLDELKADFEAGIDSYLEGCRERGIQPDKPYSGTLNIRISSDIHSRIALLAENTGMSINAFIKESIESRLKQIQE